MNENKEKKDFKSYVPANENPPEFTVTSVVMGILLAVVFGAANAYLGLRVGMTVSASIPAAVISMGVTDVLDLSAVFDTGMIGSVLVLVILVVCVFRSARRAKTS